jgi:hypothetical protein
MLVSFKILLTWVVENKLKRTAIYLLKTAYLHNHKLFVIPLYTPHQAVFLTARILFSGKKQEIKKIFKKICAIGLSFL